jgi:hypothetical protein
MDEEETGGLSGESSEHGSLQDEMAYWVEVLDRWIKRVDVGLDGRVDETQAPDGDMQERSAEDSDSATDVGG